MKIKNVEFGICRKANGSVADFELDYGRYGCDCSILILGWFYFTLLRGDCRIDSYLLDEEENE